MTRTTRPRPGTRLVKEVGREPFLVAQLFIDKQELATERAWILHAGEPDQRPCRRCRRGGRPVWGLPVEEHSEPDRQVHAPPPST